MAHICPWWGGYFIDNWIRRLLHNPAKIIGPYVKTGMTVMDVSCGMGMFSLAMARMVGDEGRVIAVDLQHKMLDVLRKRAEKVGVAGRIRFHKCEQDHLNINEPVDFALAMLMIHEVPDQQRLLNEIHDCLKPGGRLLIADVSLVSRMGFEPIRPFEQPNEKPRWNGGLPS
jgi:ubiquinone/menaquinone biosynthesis C-methylase UbiE